MNFVALHLQGRRASIMLELMIALALFVMGALAIMGAIGDGARTLRRLRTEEAAHDLARSAVAALESGLARPETIQQMVHQPRGAAPYIAAEPDEGDADDNPDAAWRIEAQTEQAPIDGLALVKISVFEGEGSESTLATLRQYVRLLPGEEDQAGKQDDLSKAARQSGMKKPGDTPSTPPAPPPNRPAGGGKP